MDTVWDKTTKIIQEKISKQNFAIPGLKPIKIAGLEDKCVRLVVPNKFFKRLADGQLRFDIKQSLKNVVRLEVDVDFVFIKNSKVCSQAGVGYFVRQKTSTDSVTATKAKDNLSLNSKLHF